MLDWRARRGSPSTTSKFQWGVPVLSDTGASPYLEVRNMSAQRYFERLGDIIRKIEATQIETIRQAAGAMARSSSSREVRFSIEMQAALGVS